MIQNTVNLRFFFLSGRATNIGALFRLFLYSSSTVDFLNSFFLSFSFFKIFLRCKECFLNRMGAIVFSMF